MRDNLYNDRDIPIKKEIILKYLARKQNNTNNEKIKKRKDKKGKRIVVIGLFILFLTILVSSIFEISSWFKDNKKTSEKIKEIQEIINVE